jgi:hypothetical protein
MMSGRLRGSPTLLSHGNFGRNRDGIALQRSFARINNKCKGQIPLPHVEAGVFQSHENKRVSVNSISASNALLPSDPRGTASAV